jgi:hypothetical protein
MPRIVSPGLISARYAAALACERMGLHVGVVRTEELPGPIERELLGNFDVLTAAVIALGRIAFRVLVREHGALCFQHTRARVVFRGNQLDMVFLTLPLVHERVREFGIEPGDLHTGGKHGHSTVA